MQANINKQEMYFWSLVRVANWTDEQVNDLFHSKFHTTIWEELSPREKRRAISIIKVYVKKQIDLKARKLRQKINAIWLCNGYSRDDMHHAMSELGYGESLSNLEYDDLRTLHNNVKDIMKSRNNVPDGYFPHYSCFNNEGE